MLVYIESSSVTQHMLCYYYITYVIQHQNHMLYNIKTKS